MTTSSTQAKQLLLEPADLSEKQLQQTLDQMVSHHAIDYADLYFQLSSAESWSCEDSIIKSGHYSLDRGVGVRAISGEKTGFAYSDDINQLALSNAAKAAEAIAKLGENKTAHAVSKIQGLNLYQPINPVDSLSVEDKIDLLKKIDQLARKKDSRIKQVIASLASSYEVVLIFSHDGKLSSDIRPLVRLNLTVIAEDNGKSESGFAGGGRRQGYEFFTDDIISKYVDDAVRQALVNLEAVDAPAGAMPVVLGPGWPGVLLHEAIGHGLEGDANRKGTSAFANKMGERIASSICTIVDDGTIAGRRGSLNIDDEGTPTQRTVLIENGILKNYMQDKLNARLMKGASTGNGRRESYQSIPIPRMTNTFMLPGKSEPEEIIRSVEKGIYAVNFGGGQVDTTSGKFVFSANEAYLIEKGKITKPVKGATLIGNGPDVLTKVSMVGNNLDLDSGVGICGKDGQSVPVGVGQPTIKVDELIIGGTK